jgi:hypothetical protein
MVSSDTVGVVVGGFLEYYLRIRIFLAVLFFNILTSMNYVSC